MNNQIPGSRKILFHLIAFAICNVILSFFYETAEGCPPFSLALIFATLLSIPTVFLTYIIVISMWKGEDYTDLNHEISKTPLIIGFWLPTFVAVVWLVICYFSSCDCQSDDLDKNQSIDQIYNKLIIDNQQHF